VRLFPWQDLTMSPDDELRCIAHPGRPAVDRCPVCDRPRCGADAGGAGCAVCRGAGTAGRAGSGSDLERVVRGALGATVVAVPSAWVLSEYVGSPTFQYLAPVVVGVACASAAVAAAGDPRVPALRTRVRVVATLYAVLATALGFVLDGTYGVLTASTDVLVPYVAAAGGAWLWSAPPRGRRRTRS
jgi:hypothetical protein